MALLDVTTGHFLHQERLNREGWDARAAVDRLDVANGPWGLQMTDPVTEQMLLRGGIRGEASFTLELTPSKPLVRFGENGYSRKGADPTAASYYLTFPRIAARGELELGTENLTVTGELWMDHEISSSQLSAGQVGWDWISVHFTDQRELMLYRLRRSDSSADPASTLTWVDADGRTQVAPFTWTVQSTWKSAKTGAVYPSKVKVVTTDPATGASVELFIEPLAESQELTGELGGGALLGRRLPRPRCLRAGDRIGLHGADRLCEGFEDLARRKPRGGITSDSIGAAARARGPGCR